MQLYELDKYGVDQHASDPTKFTDPIYEKALDTWVQGDFDDFIVDIQTVI